MKRSPLYVLDKRRCTGHVGSERSRHPVWRRLFTTARIQQGQVALLDAHLQRLQTTCEKLHIPFNDWLTLSEEMQRLARPHAQGVLKVTLTRGVGEGGYSAAGCVSPTRILSFSPYAGALCAGGRRALLLTQSPVPLGRNSWLAGLKHLNRPEAGADPLSS